MTSVKCVVGRETNSLRETEKYLSVQDTLLCWDVGERVVEIHERERWMSSEIVLVPN